MAESNLPTNVTRLRPAPAPNEARPIADPEARRAEKRLRELSEPVEPWDRYKALRQTLDEAQKFEDLADHKARFAMILMGGLNALLLFGALSDGVGAGSLASQPKLAGYLVLCGLAVIYLFHQAVEALRPRGLRRPAAPPGADAEAASLGLRHHEDVLRLSHGDYLAAWRQVRVEQLNDQIALQVHRQAEVNRAKERALTRLYAGLRVMMLLLVGLLVLALVTGQERETRVTDPGKEGRSSGDKVYKLQPGHAPKLRLGNLVGS